MEKEKFNSDYIKNIKAEEFNAADVLVKEDFEELLNEGWFLDESQEAEAILTDEEKQVIRDFEEGTLE